MSANSNLTLLSFFEIVDYEKIFSLLEEIQGPVEVQKYFIEFAIKEATRCVSRQHGKTERLHFTAWLVYIVCEYSKCAPFCRGSQGADGPLIISQEIKAVGRCWFTLSVETLSSVCLSVCLSRHTVEEECDAVNKQPPFFFFLSFFRFKKRVLIQHLERILEEIEFSSLPNRINHVNSR